MTKKEVINGLKWIIDDETGFGFGNNWENGKPQCDEERAGEYIWEAIQLLENKDSVPPKLKTQLVMACGYCGRTIESWDSYCPNCGKEIKRDG